MMSANRAFSIAVALVFAVIVFLYWLGRRDDRMAAAKPSPARVSAVAPGSVSLPAVAVARGDGEAASDLARYLNAPGGNIRRDLEAASELFVAWQSNFPRAGNPVGDNAEITAALTGANPLRFAFLPREHRAINARGELCDRWGTPLRFHQLSGLQMEIVSAGPDRRFATADDAQWPEAGE